MCGARFRAFLKSRIDLAEVGVVSLGFCDTRATG
ncbi:hypothetical protein E3G59_004036 [Mycobacteroides abscessus]|nr:hypothetical protein [Mycobacteroides abscessus]SID89970.1 Uncharacterised protein [Mycobacteroides abscessus subsp. abscessus]SKW53788.1 Uncharacterised protein [Mycobacteroides abscessus subsp. abscessus]SKX67854.1 Uncharacterised protein [Mycobacteroides abscessus subsp. abscessus]SKX98852.1 Uncharacterised protein [Mycobacteroides abscessus subsp. abscessus]